MDIKNMIIQKLTQYLLKKIQREELYKYAVDMIHKMLHGDIFYLKNLEIWGILAKIAEIDDVDDFYCDIIAKQCYDVLTGMQNDTFIFAMHIPPEYVGDCFTGLKEILIKYNKEKTFSIEEIQKLNAIIQKQVDVITTINEFLEVQILDILKLGYMFCDDEGGKYFYLKSSVFISDKEAELLEERILSKIISLLECYTGKKAFFVQIVYEDGRGNISILA